MITRERILELITEEKERFAEYAKLCTHYKTETDVLITAKKEAALEILAVLLKDASTSRS